MGGPSNSDAKISTVLAWVGVLMIFGFLSQCDYKNKGDQPSPTPSITSTQGK